MKEHPILFSGAMVRALLRDENPKTQTRRIVKPQFEREPVDVIDGVPSWDAPTNYDGEVQINTTRGKPCPYGVPGDRLYVRETWQHSNHPLGPYDEDCLVFYRADYLDDPLGPDLERSSDGIRRQWRPSIHMPRAASRITLEVTDVRVERLNDISDADVRAEGVESSDNSIHPYAFAYGQLWEELNGKGSWYANPWTWVIEFRRVG